jgi:hypothetical protein
VIALAIERLCVKVNKIEVDPDIAVNRRAR